MRNGFDIAWLLVGLFGTLTLIAILYTVSEQWVRSKRIGNRAQTYERIFLAVDAMLDRKADPRSLARHRKSLLSLLQSNRTTADAIEALADAARARPQVATVLRGEAGAVRAITYWVDGQLASSDAFERAHAVEVIASLRMRSCRGSLAAATSDSEPTVRAGACRALAAIDPKAAIGALLRVVDTDGTWAADLLADLLARAQSTELATTEARDVDVLQGTEFAVTEADEETRVAQDPGSLRIGSVTEPLLGGEREAVNARLLDWAATPALLRIADQTMPNPAKRALASALEAADPEMRLRAVSMLRLYPLFESGPALERLVSDDVEAVRIAAIQALAQFGRDEHIMLLAALVGDDSRMVRFAAAEALRTMDNGDSLLRAMARGSNQSAAEAASLALWQSDPHGPRSSSGSGVFALRTVKAGE